MKKLFIFSLFALLAFSLNAQTLKTITWDNQERQYLEFVPSTYSATTPAPLLFMLHGMGDEATNFFNGTQIKNIASEKGWIVVCPQALEFDWEFPGLGSHNFGTCWNIGSTISVSFNTYGIPFNFDVTVNEDADDEGFLMATLGALEEEYNINQDSVFFAGFSLGGFMCHRMAIEHGDVINSIAAVSGVIGNDMDDLTPVDNVNVLQIFGTSDEVVSYDSAMISLQSLGYYNLGLPVEETVEYWRAFNQCDEEPVFEQYPDTFNDGLTFEMYRYENGNNDSRVAFIKVINGKHNWYAGNLHDIDYNTEIVKFFTGTTDVTEVDEQAENTLTFYPNPATDYLYVDTKKEVKIFDLCGKLVLQSQGTSKIDVSSLSDGMYFVKQGDYCGKLVINR